MSNELTRQRAWRGTPCVDAGSPVRYALLEGDPLKPGVPFTIRLGCDDGYKAAPHWHPTDENVVGEPQRILHELVYAHCFPVCRQSVIAALLQILFSFPSLSSQFRNPMTCS
jgi:hypothetical protein